MIAAEPEPTDMTRDLESENAAFEDISSWAHGLDGSILDVADLNAHFNSLPKVEILHFLH